MKRKGLALIAVIVMIILFSSLILAVVLSATMAIRRANYYKDKLIALEIAENGLQKILYNLNYYGYQENNSGSDWTRASWIGSNFINPVSFSLPKWYSDLIANKGLTENDLTKYETTVTLPEYGGKGKYTLYFIDANSQTNPETDLDLIVCKGIYRGRATTISFLLRGVGEIKNYGDNYFYGDFKEKNLNRRLGSCGIPEAFNKHVIYAYKVTFPSSPTGINIKGNITYATITNKPTNLSQATWTETNINFLDYIPRFETEIYSFDIPNLPPTIPPSPPYSGYDVRYTNDGRVCIPPNATPGTPVNNQNDGVYWDDASNTYYFGTDDGSNPANFTSQGKTLVEANVIIPNIAGNVTIKDYFNVAGSTTPNINGDLTINKSITTTTDPDFCFEVRGTLNIASGININGNFIVKGQPLNLNINVNGNVKCNQDITINGGTINGDVISNGGNITINNGNIGGNLKATGDITIQNGNIGKDALSNSSITISGGTINGCVLCYDNSSKNHTITISNNPTINASNSNYDAVIYINNSYFGSSGTINIIGSPTITLGEKQRVGICISVLNGQGNININNNFVLKYYNPTNPTQPSDYPFNQFAIVNYSGGSNSKVSINANLNLNGAIYSFNDIEFNNSNQNITGFLVAGNTLTIGNYTNISYFSNQYKNKNPDVFKEFVGGRRKYLPVVGSWRIEW